MELSARLPSRSSSPAAASVLRLDWGGFASWLLAGTLVVYLALENGGYDPITRNEIGIAVWWLALCTVGVGALPGPRGKAGIAIVALFGAFAIWTALSLTWTDSTERTANELARVSTYLGVLVLGISACSVQGRARHVLNGVATGVAVVACLAVLSRLHPSWFPVNTLDQFLPGIEIERRLAYPFGYSSAVGAFAAIGIPLMAGAAAWARTIAGQALAAATLPILGFMAILASSGTGTAACLVGLAVLVALAPDRLPLLGTLILGGAGTAILAIGLTDRAALDRGLPTPEAMSQGDELLLIAIVLCAGVALAQVGLSLATRYGQRPAWLRVSRGQAGLATAVALVVAIPVALAAGVPGEVSDQWESFKGQTSTVEPGDRGGSLFDVSSSGRYQIWEGGVRASELDPLKGIGPGTFELYWAQDPQNFGFVRDAHSLYIESLAELGYIGFLLIVGLALGTLAIGVTRSVRASAPARTRIAAATAAAMAFATAAALDWIWEIAALPVLFLLLVAVIACDLDENPGRRRRRRRQRLSTRTVVVTRVATVAIAAAGLLALVSPLRGETGVRDSQIAVANGDLDTALADAENAASAQGYAATPDIQRALVLELQGELNAAVKSARIATEDQPSEWRNWLILSRLEARTGDAEASVAAFRQVQRLNPKTYAPQQ